MPSSPIPLPEDPPFYYSPIYALVFKSGLFPSGFPTKTLYTPLLSPHLCCINRPSHYSRFYHPNNIWWGAQIIRLLIMQFPPLSFYFVPLRPKYSSQQLILKHPQPTFLHQCERSSFTPIQNNAENYSSVYLNLYIFG
jgi:hypothetical protein